jgi:hypothetical protein
VPLFIGNNCKVYYINTTLSNEFIAPTFSYNGIFIPNIILSTGEQLINTPTNLTRFVNQISLFSGSNIVYQCL